MPKSHKTRHHVARTNTPQPIVEVQEASGGMFSSLNLGMIVHIIVEIVVLSVAGYYFYNKFSKLSNVVSANSESIHAIREENRMIMGQLASVMQIRPANIQRQNTQRQNTQRQNVRVPPRNSSQTINPFELIGEAMSSFSDVQSAVTKSQKDYTKKVNIEPPKVVPVVETDDVMEKEVEEELRLLEEETKEDYYSSDDEVEID